MIHDGVPWLACNSLNYDTYINQQYIFVIVIIPTKTKLKSYYSVNSTINKDIYNYKINRIVQINHSIVIVES